MATETPEEMQERLRQEHLAKQQGPTTLWDPMDPDGSKCESEHKNPAAMFPVSESPGVRDDSGMVAMFGSIGGKAAKIINEVAGTDEPIFVFRAKDIFSIMVVSHYIELLERFGPEAHDMVISASEQLAAMKAWQKANVDKVRYPD